MRRRTFLAVTAPFVGGVAGCLDGTGRSPDADRPAETGERQPTLAGTDPDPAITTAGLAPDPDPDATGDPVVEPSTFDTYQYDGRAIPLVPLDVARAWYHGRRARFVDARSETQYERYRIEGAVHSPAPDGLDEGDPTADWPMDERIVTYCVCPHTMASMRAASLLDGGHAAVYAIETGLEPWIENGYPAAGTAVDTPVAYAIDGRVDPVHAGEFATVRHEPTGQREVTRIDDTGSFAMEVRFVDVDPSTLVTLETPTDAIIASLGDLEADRVTLV